MSRRFADGARVRVRASAPPGHVRTPWFVRGRPGQVIGVAGSFPNAEEMAYGRDGLPATPVYRVRFRQTELWPEYGGPARDSTVVDIYEHWLEPGEGDEA